MTGDRITLAEAKRRLRETYEAERTHFMQVMDEGVPRMAAELGVPVEEFRAAIEPHLARQLATLEEIRRLAETDLEVISKPEDGTGSQ